MPTDVRTAQPGNVLTLAEDDYVFGRGQLTLRVETVGGYHTARDATWRQITGWEIRWNGAQDTATRTVWVKVSR